MHQISPAPSNKTPGSDTIALSIGQSVLAEQFDVFTYLEHDLDAVAHEACRVAAKGLEARFAGVFRFRSDKDAFVLQAGTGWPARLVGGTWVAADRGTTAEVSWITGQLVHLHQLDATSRIKLPAALVGQGTYGVASVRIHGGHNEWFGVLEVVTTDAGTFTPQDFAFLQRTADSVAVAFDLYASRAGRTKQAGLFEERNVNRADTGYQQDMQYGGG